MSALYAPLMANFWVLALNKRGDCFNWLQPALIPCRHVPFLSLMDFVWPSAAGQVSCWRSQIWRTTFCEFSATVTIPYTLKCESASRLTSKSFSLVLWLENSSWNSLIYLISRYWQNMMEFCLRGIQSRNGYQIPIFEANLLAMYLVWPLCFSMPFPFRCSRSLRHRIKLSYFPCLDWVLHWSVNFPPLPPFSTSN